MNFSINPLKLSLFKRIDVSFFFFFFFVQVFSQYIYLFDSYHRLVQPSPPPSVTISFQDVSQQGKIPGYYFETNPNETVKPSQHLVDFIFSLLPLHFVFLPSRLH